MNLSEDQIIVKYAEKCLHCHRNTLLLSCHTNMNLLA